MRQKQRPDILATKASKAPIRIFLHTLAAPEGLGKQALEQFSAMKYGDPEAVAAIGLQLASFILDEPQFKALLLPETTLFLASSAFGAVPSAAATLTEIVYQTFRLQNLAVQHFKIIRDGGFARTNYGALESEEREKAIRHRKISLEAGWAEKLNGNTVVIVDDLRSTGAHERAIEALFAKETENVQLVFVYCIGFQAAIRAAHEEQLNHALIQAPEDLLPLFLADENSPLLNARMLKFILLMKRRRMQKFLDHIGKAHALRLYKAAISDDGYCLSARFRDGFTVLEEWAFAQNCIEKRHSFNVRNAFQQKVVVWNLEETDEGNFLCSERGHDLNDAIRLYSQFKFGDVEAIRFFAHALAAKVIAELEAGGSLLETFQSAAEKGEYVSITAPGVRNVVSASNFLMREMAMLVNIWLTRANLPTMVIRSLGRLGSGTANYAELSSKARSIRQKTTQTIIPRSEYRNFPMHVIFVDDVEVSGQTANRARTNTLSAGALSFHGFFAFRVHPLQARRDASIEHRLNHYFVTGKLDEGLAKILSHPDYQPVQRMLRLLLHPRNQTDLCTFIEKHLSDSVLLRIYLAAMANDYLWIHSQKKGEIGEYAPSLNLMAEELKRRQAIDANGMPIRSHQTRPSA